MTDSDDDKAPVAAKVEPATAEAPTVEAPIAEELDESEAVDEALAAEEATDGAESEQSDVASDKRSIEWSRILAYIVLPALVLVIALAAAAFKYVDSSARDATVAGAEAMQAARETTLAILSYKPETVEQQLTDARSRLTGDFRDSYTDLTNKVVIPGSKQQQISDAARVPAVAVVSADPEHAVVLVFVNQTVTIGAGTPSETASSVRVTLDKVDGKWLVSKFDPV